MGALEQVTQLRNQGMSDEDISSSLQQQGVSPKEITDAINQSNIKNAVSGGNAQGEYEAGGESEGGYAPQTQDYSQGNQRQRPAAAPQEYYEEAPYATGPAAGMSSDTMIELSSQVFAEKIKKTSKSVDEFSEFKGLAQVKLENIEERLKRIEKIIDTIQIKILEKVGAFASELQKTQKEIEMVEESFSKVAMPKTSSKSSKKK